MEEGHGFKSKNCSEQQWPLSTRSNIDQSKYGISLQTALTWIKLFALAKAFHILNILENGQILKTNSI